MDRLTPDEARARFGALQDAPTRTYREFEDPEGGVWRPVYNGGELQEYRFYKLHKLKRKVVWRKPSRR